MSTTITPTETLPNANPGVPPMTIEEEARIREVLDHIGQTDPVAIAKLLAICRIQAGARAALLQLWEEIPPPSCPAADLGDRVETAIL